MSTMRVRAGFPGNVVPALIEDLGSASQSTRSSKSRVKREPARAKGTPSQRPQCARRGPGSRAGEGRPAPPGAKRQDRGDATSAGDPHSCRKTRKALRSRRWSGRTRCGCCAAGCGRGAAATGGQQGVRALSPARHRARSADVGGCDGVADYRAPGEPALGLACSGPGAIGENWLLPAGDEARSRGGACTCREGARPEADNAPADADTGWWLGHATHV